jgi:pyrroloquinoline quinone (PQQ) biosynthesis protein C
MNTTNSDLKQFTEPITATLDRYRAALAQHPLLVAAHAGQIERETLLQFAYYQYADSITWIPMLAQMKSMALRSPRLRRAVEDNIGHEAGLGDRTSHVALAAALMRSLGVRDLAPFPTSELGRTASMWLSDAFARTTEPALAGWLLVAETLVPQLFAALRPCFAALAGADTRYFDEHIAVDTDEHATWMAEAVAEILTLYGPACVPEILAGMADAWTETCEDPDALVEELEVAPCASP